MAPHTLGIDFGTSNSAAGYLANGLPKLVEIEPSQTTLPTSVFFDFDNRNTVFGTPANMALINGEYGRFMRALKSVLGTSLMHEKRRLLNERLDFVDIIAKFLATLKSRAEAASGHEFSHALSGRPVHFHSDDPKKDKQAEADLRACYLKAGFKDVRFMYEPEAAALANNSHLAKGALGLIVDIGGGTSDFSLFRLDGSQNVQVIASHGVRVGGTDFDRKLSLEHVMPLLGKGSDIRDIFGDNTSRAPNAIFHKLATWERIPFLYNTETLREVAELEKLAVEPKLLSRLTSTLKNEIGHDIAFAVERGKIDANRPSNPTGKIDLDILERGLFVELSGTHQNKALEPLARKIEICAQETLAMAGVTAAQVDSVIYVGGSSLMGVVETVISREFPTATPQKTSAFTAVADGLSIASATAF